MSTVRKIARIVVTNSDPTIGRKGTILTEKSLGQGAFVLEDAEPSKNGSTLSYEEYLPSPNRRYVYEVLLGGGEKEAQLDVLSRYAAEVTRSLERPLAGGATTAPSSGAHRPGGSGASSGAAPSNRLDLSDDLCASQSLRTAIESALSVSVDGCSPSGSFQAGGIQGFNWQITQSSGSQGALTTAITDTNAQGPGGGVAPFDGPKGFFGKGSYGPLPSVGGYPCFESTVMPMTDMYCFPAPGEALGVNGSLYAQGGTPLTFTTEQLHTIGDAMLQALGAPA